MEWQPIETAPRDGTRIILAYSRRAVIGHYSMTEHRDHGEVTFRSEGWRYPGYFPITFHGGEEPQPTHWMHVPKVPDTEGQ